jgi:Tol biopolymer transport system component
VLTALFTALVVAAGAGATPRADAGSGTWLPGGSPRAHTGFRHLAAELSHVAGAARTSGSAAGIAAARAQDLAVAQGDIRVIVQPTAGIAPAEAAVASVGGEVEATADGLVEALVPPAELPRLADQRAVADVRPPATPYAEAVSDEGVAETSASAWQAAGFDGTGVKIAIIDLGFIGYQALLGSALPASVVTDNRCGGASTSSVAVGTDHGTAVAEIVHQMAPAAQLYLICVDNEVDLALAEQDAIGYGVKIVNHSVAWFNTSRGDGTGGPGSPDATVADARAHGILWVNAAGNYATQHWSGVFSPDAQDADVNDFAPGATLNLVTVGSGKQVCAFLRWDAWPLTSEDFDLYLVDPSTDDIVDSSTNDQSGSLGTSTENLCYTNSGPTRNLGVGIVRYSAATTPQFDLFVTGGSGIQYQTAAGSIVEPASSPDALAVGAACWTAPATPELFSSHGPTIDGRVKPDLLAPDSVTTQTYGAGTGTCGSAGFAGTSAAAPQAAGAAALLLQRTPSLDPSGLAAGLEAPTLSHTFSASSSTTSGAGGLWLGGLVHGGSFLTADGSRIWTSNDDGTGVATVGSNFPLGGSDPVFAAAWSPDAAKIVFVANSGSGPYGVYVVNSDGSGLHSVVVDQFHGFFHNPSWTSDGSQVTYDDGDSVFRVNLDGTGKTLVLASAGFAAWAPDGTKIAYLHPSSDPLAQLWVANADGTGAAQVSSGSFRLLLDQPSAWSPDGTKLAFVRDDFTVWVVNADGSGEHEVAEGFSPQWSADGSRIMIVQGHNFTYGLARSFLPDGTGGETLGELPDPLDPPSGGLNWRSQTAATPPRSTGAPTASGDLHVGAALRVDVGHWAGAYPLALTFAWTRCDASGNNCVPVPGATADRYRLTPADAGHRLDVSVTATGNAGSASASAISGVVAVAKPLASSLPTVSGSTVLSVASPGVWSGSPAFTFQWRRCDQNGTTCADVPGQTGSAYTVGNADIGHTLRVSVTGTNAGGSAVATSTAGGIIALPPGAPTGVTAVAANGQATVSFAAPSNGGSPITGYLVTTSPGGIVQAGAASPIVVTGLTNGVTYTFTVVATNAIGSGPASAPSNAVTPAGTGGGGGGGGGGSSSFSLTLSPATQTVASGGTATWTVSVTNTGGGYLFVGGLSDGAAPGCNTPSAYSDTLYTWAPGVTVTYTCSRPGVTAGFTNTIVGTATNAAGSVLTQTASATVNVSGGSSTPVPLAPSSSSSSGAGGNTTSTVTFSLSGLKTVHLKVRKPKLTFAVHLSRAATVGLMLLDAKGHTLAHWSEKGKAGANTFSLLLPVKARHAGHDRLRVTASGNTRAKVLAVTFQA